MATSALPREMIPADRIPARSSVAIVDTALGPIRLTLYADFEPLGGLWTRFQETAVASCAQTHVWMEAWFRLVAAPGGAELAIIVGRDAADRPVFIWPFEVVERIGVRTLDWIGQAHANYCMGLSDPVFAGNVGAHDMAALLHRAADLIGNVKAALFRDQPTTWDGVENPMRHLPHQPSPSRCYALELCNDFHALQGTRFSKRSRSTLARKERRLAQEGALEYGWAETPQARLALLDVFFRQKENWFAELGIPDAFADPRHRAFYRAMAALETSDPAHLRIGYLRVGGETAATFNGVMFRGRLYVLLSSMTPGELQRWSPGMLLLGHQIEEACQQGLSHYDLGAGEAPHKLQWCNEQIERFDSFIAFDGVGQVVARLYAAKSAIKRRIKTSPRLWQLAQAARRLITRLRRQEHRS